MERSEPALPGDGMLVRLLEYGEKVFDLCSKGRARQAPDSHRARGAFVRNIDVGAFGQPQRA